MKTVPMPASYSVRLFGQEFCDEIDRHAADDNIRPADTSEKDQA